MIKQAGSAVMRVTPAWTSIRIVKLSGRLLYVRAAAKSLVRQVGSCRCIAKSSTRKPSTRKGRTSVRVIKRQFGYTKVRFRGRSKNTGQQAALFTLSNNWGVRKRLPGIGKLHLSVENVLGLC
ncbi:ISPssy, transposase [Pseudomonas cannabina]|uniref:ISPssy, transposase n=1 Tax=Pseudomonas cannabina TaxID=86840 RepID=A0A0P9LG26_PSECA|nr:ISPssy, transposase [Pseudomonas cannabina]